jgi:hypothetical protein
MLLKEADYAPITDRAFMKLLEIFLNVVVFMMMSSVKQCMCVRAQGIKHMKR